jgi:hypothetical protein
MVCHGVVVDESRVGKPKRGLIVSNEPEGASQSGGSLPDIHVNTGLTLGALAVGLLAGLAVTRWPVLAPWGR